jgi:hypothetical protein
MGQDDLDVTLAGTLSGSTAVDRARELDSLRTSGDTVRLTWHTFQYDVVIRQFLAEFHTGHWIPFQLTCAVVRPLGTGGSGSAEITGIQLSELLAVPVTDPTVAGIIDDLRTHSARRPDALVGALRAALTRLQAAQAQADSLVAALAQDKEALAGNEALRAATRAASEAVLAQARVRATLVALG